MRVNTVRSLQTGQVDTMPNLCSNLMRSQLSGTAVPHLRLIYALFGDSSQDLGANIALRRVFRQGSGAGMHQELFCI